MLIFLLPGMKHENVPTWNYQAVHVYGKASILEKNELIEDLTIMLEKYEEHREESSFMG